MNRKMLLYADFIGDSNILPATMVEDKVVKILGAVWNCVDVGFGHNKPVDAVIRPEDIDLVAPGEGVINGVVTNLIFKGFTMKWKFSQTIMSFLFIAPICSRLEQKSE